MSQITVPKGTKDIHYPEIAKWQFLEDQVREFFGRFLYREIRTPVFEHSELFQRGIGSETEVVQKEMYTFPDKAGRSLTLRPENTASVVRAAIENKLFEHHFPLKFYYIGPMFRYDKPQKGRYRQFHQFGIEVFGDESPECDAEVIYAAVEFLRQLGISGLNLKLNSVGCNACRPSYLERLRQAAAAHEEALCADCRRKVHTNPLRIFDCKNNACQAISHDFPKITDHLCIECGSHFHHLKEVLKLMKVEYIIDDRLVRGLDYYTRTAFEITSDQLGAQNSILGGGRYNNLIRELGGPDLPGIGFAAGMERVILHLEQLRVAEPAVLCVAFQDQNVLGAALELGDKLRRAGHTVYIDYQSKNLKKQFKKADKAGARFTFIIGEDEVRRGVLSVKDMQKQEQTQIPAEEWQTWLKQQN